MPWQQPWNYSAGRPRSLSSLKPYRGVNTLLLGLTASERGYESPLWGTYKQIAALGGQVRRGQSATRVVLWKSARRTFTNDDGDREQRVVLIAREFSVFNAEQADGLPQRFYGKPDPADVEELAEPQTVLNSYLAGGPGYCETAGDRAYYDSGHDRITLPLRKQFKSSGAYYSTAFHEAAHSTGHPKRLDRPGLGGSVFGCESYAREELVGQMTASMLLAATGIDSAELFANSARPAASRCHHQTHPTTSPAPTARALSASSAT